MSDTENTLIDSLFEQYYELFPNKSEINCTNSVSECEHKHITTTIDSIYYVCSDCGTCTDYTNIQSIEFDMMSSRKIKRCYKKTNYLKLKINKLIKNMNFTRQDISTILKKFIKYENLYANNKKRIKYDFILCIILKEMGKDTNSVKKFKVKLEKKRLKEFNELMPI